MSETPKYVWYQKPKYVHPHGTGGLINISDREGLKYEIEYKEIVEGIEKTFKETLSPGEYQLRESMTNIVISVSSSDINLYIMTDGKYDSDWNYRAIDKMSWSDFKYRAERVVPKGFKEVDSFTTKGGRVSQSSTRPGRGNESLRITFQYYSIEIDRGDRGKYVTTEPKTYRQIESFFETIGEDIGHYTNYVTVTNNKEDLVYEGMVPITYISAVPPSYVDPDEIGGLINIPDVEGLKYQITYNEVIDGTKKTFNETLPPGEYQLKVTMEGVIISAKSSNISLYQIKTGTVHAGDGTPTTTDTVYWYKFKYKGPDYRSEYAGRGRIYLYDISSGKEVRIPPEEFSNFIEFNWGGVQKITPRGASGDFYKEPYPYGRHTVKVNILNDEYIFVEGHALISKAWNSSDNQTHYWFYDNGDGKTGEVEIARWGPKDRDGHLSEATAGFRLYIKKGTVGGRKEVVAIPPQEWGNNDIYLYAQEGVEYYNGRTGNVFEEGMIKVEDSDHWRGYSDVGMGARVYATEEPFVIAARVKDPSRFILKKPEKPPINFIGAMPDENPYALRAWEYIWDSQYARDRVSPHIGMLYTLEWNGSKQFENAREASKYIAVWVNDVRIRPFNELGNGRSAITAVPRRKKNSVIIEYRDNGLYEDGNGSFISSIRTTSRIQGSQHPGLSDDDAMYPGIGHYGLTKMTYGYRGVILDDGRENIEIFMRAYGGKFRLGLSGPYHTSYPNPQPVTPLPGYTGGSALIPAGHPLPPPNEIYWYFYSTRPLGFDVPIFDLTNPDLIPPPYIDPFPDPYPDLEPDPDVDIPPGVDDIIIPADPVDPEAPEPDPVYPTPPPPEDTDEPVEPAPVGYTKITVKGNATVDVYDAKTNMYITTIAPSVPRYIRNSKKYIFRAYASQGYTFSGLGKFKVNNLVHSLQQLNNDHTRMRDLLFTPYGSLEFEFTTIRIIEGNPVDTVGINNVYLVDEEKTSELSFDIMVNKEATIIVDPRTSRAIKANLTDYIINLLQLPFRIPSENIVGEQQILLGLKSVNTAAPVLNTDSITIDLGKVTVPGKYNNSYDYSNTSIAMHLPYHNAVPLEPNYVLGHEVGVKYVVNLYTGQTTINITSSFINGNVILSVDTMIGNNIPFIDPKITKGVINDNNIQPVLNNNTPRPMIEVTRNIPYQMDSQFNKDIRTTVDQLGSESGYVYVHDIDIDIDTTLDELSAIKSTLASGIIIK